MYHEARQRRKNTDTVCSALTAKRSRHPEFPSWVWDLNFHCTPCWPSIIRRVSVSITGNGWPTKIAF